MPSTAGATLFDRQPKYIEDAADIIFSDLCPDKSALVTAVSDWIRLQTVAGYHGSRLTESEIEATIESFARCAALARLAGYDGVEVMGSEGYLINEFIVAATNHREDRWGGTYANRIRFPLEIVRRIRERTGPHFIVIYRLSMLDLVNGGSTWEEVVELARAVEVAGATTAWTPEQVVRVAQLLRGASSEKRGPVAFIIDPDRTAFPQAFAELTKGEGPIDMFRSLGDARAWLRKVEHAKTHPELAAAQAAVPPQQTPWSDPQRQGVLIRGDRRRDVRVRELDAA